MKKPTVRLDGKSLTVFDVVHAARDRYPVVLDERVWDDVRRGRDIVERTLDEHGPFYGVNTGVGSQKDYTLQHEEIAAFNRRLLVAHATVVSDHTLSETAVRAALVVQLNQLSTGLSGVRTELLQALLGRVHADQLPKANVGASVGASDLVPLAQMALSLLGVNNPLESEEPLAGTITLDAKEALSLMNSNAVSLGDGALTLLQARKLLRGFDLSACFALEGFRGNLSGISSASVRAHPQPGQHTAAQHMRRLLAGSALWQDARLLQDPLSFRCTPQVHGAAYSALEWVWQHWEIELNSLQDNPIVDWEAETLVSHGNMDGTLLTLGVDTLRAALATVVDLSAQRLHKLHWPAFSGLPTGLALNDSALGGVQFLNVGHISEAYAARVRARARPATLNYQGQLADGVEDHATLLPHGVTETEYLVDAAWVVQALELAVACWAIQRRGLRVDQLGTGLRDVYREIEPLLPIGREGHQVFDVRPLVDLVRDGDIVDLIDDVAPPVPERIDEIRR